VPLLEQVRKPSDIQPSAPYTMDKYQDGLVLLFAHRAAKSLEEAEVDQGVVSVAAVARAFFDLTQVTMPGSMQQALYGWFGAERINVTSAHRVIMHGVVPRNKTLTVGVPETMTSLERAFLETAKRGDAKTLAVHARTESIRKLLSEPVVQHAMEVTDSDEVRTVLSQFWSSLFGPKKVLLDLVNDFDSFGNVLTSNQGVYVSAFFDSDVRAFVNAHRRDSTAKLIVLVPTIALPASVKQQLIFPDVNLNKMPIRSEHAAHESEELVRTTLDQQKVRLTRLQKNRYYMYNLEDAFSVNKDITPVKLKDATLVFVDGFQRYLPKLDEASTTDDSSGQYVSIPVREHIQQKLRDAKSEEEIMEVVNHLHFWLSNTQADAQTPDEFYQRISEHDMSHLCGSLFTTLSELGYSAESVPYQQVDALYDAYLRA